MGAISNRLVKMREVTGNIWDAQVDAICVTTNGITKRDGRAVMGKGIALEAVKRFPGIDITLGSFLIDFGNRVHHIYSCLKSERSENIVSFPTKHHWRDKSDIDLILISCRQLIELTNREKWSKVALPRVGCGNGGLTWTLVKTMISDLLDDRFIIYYEKL